jgi:hypothetical protein
MKDRIQRATERVSHFLAERDERPRRTGLADTRRAASGPSSLESVGGILGSVATLGKIGFAYWAVQTVRSLWNSAKEGIEEEQRAERNRERAARDLADTKRRQEEKDTQEIQQGVRQDFIDRERKKFLPVPKSVRGHWEGHVFIPKESPGKPGKPAKQTQGAKDASATKRPKP